MLPIVSWYLLQAYQVGFFSTYKATDQPLPKQQALFSWSHIIKPRMHPNQQVSKMEGAAICSSTNTPEEGIDLTQISLRPIDLSDLDDLMLWATDEKVAEYCTWEPYTSKEDGINFIQNIASKSLWFRAICLHNRAIGCIDLFSCSSQRRCGDKAAEIGYALGSKYWGKGIATQVVKQVVKAAFTEFPHLERLEALVDVENVGSQRVLEKAGFQKEGVLRKYLIIKGKSRDMVMFSVLSNDPHI